MADKIPDNPEQLLAEQFDRIDRKLDTILSNMDEMNSCLDRIIEQVEQMNAIAASMKERFP